MNQNVASRLCIAVFAVLALLLTSHTSHAKSCCKEIGADQTRCRHTQGCDPLVVNHKITCDGDNSGCGAKIQKQSAIPYTRLMPEENPPTGKYTFGNIGLKAFIDSYAWRKDANSNPAYLSIAGNDIGTAFVSVFSVYALSFEGGNRFKFSARFDLISGKEGRDRYPDEVKPCCNVVLVHGIATAGEDNVAVEVTSIESRCKGAKTVVPTNTEKYKTFVKDLNLPLVRGLNEFLHGEPDKETGP